ncbi:MAG: AAA domain-containing protein, partial [Planctomycetota bacterium]
RGTSLFRFFSGDFWRDRKVLAAVRRPGARRESEEVILDLRTARTVRDLGAEIDRAAEWAEAAFGRFFDGHDTDWEKLDRLCEWTTKLHEFVGGEETTEEVAALAANPVGAADRSLVLTKSLEAMRAELAAFRELTGAREDPADGPEPVLAWSQIAHDRREEVHDWCAYRRAIETCREEGLQDWIDAADRENLSADEIAPAYEKAFFTAWLDLATAEREALRDFDGPGHEATVARFRELDRRQLPLAAERIRGRLDDELPSSMSFSPDSDVGLLLKEAAKKRRHLPIRQLLRRAGLAIRRLKPCVMMSPISVAQFLPPDSEPFDLIVFDEASQICPEDAIGALARGRKMVVVGDSRQLPPTSFFSYDPDYEPPEEEEPLPDLESILDLCAAQGFPRLRLNWHYRSRDESLISFSNENFYDDSLLTFPNPGDRPGTGLSFRHVANGVYDRGKSRTNRVEAAEVARGIAEQILIDPSMSIGVVTFGEPQRRAVLAAVERLMKEEPTLEKLLERREEDEPFFVKNLENVQGDERDVMFFSFGYGPDTEGKIRLNFGPLNGDGGHRRLNVAVTRARFATRVYSSLVPEDIDLDRAKAEGARLLRSYMEKARDNGNRGGNRGADPVGERGKLPPLVGAIADAFTKRGYEVAPRIGASSYRIDLAVEGPGETDGFLLGIESDGPAYRDASTVRDRDRTRGEVLAGLGWRLTRVWSTDWARAPEREAERLVEALVSGGV